MHALKKPAQQGHHLTLTLEGSTYPGTQCSGKENAGCEEEMTWRLVAGYKENRNDLTTETCFSCG